MNRTVDLEINRIIQMAEQRGSEISTFYDLVRMMIFSEDEGSRELGIEILGNFERMMT